MKEAILSENDIVTEASVREACSQIVSTEGLLNQMKFNLEKMLRNFKKAGYLPPAEYKEVLLQIENVFNYLNDPANETTPIGTETKDSFKERVRSELKVLSKN